MKLFLIVWCSTAALALPAQDPSKLKSKKHIVEIGGVHYDVKPGPEVHQEAYYVGPEYSDVYAAATHDKAVHGHPPTGYSVGGSLVSIAQGAADQAHLQLASQHSAGKQAAFVAKSQLAQSAGQSAATAGAALTGKTIIVLGLEQQVHDARVALDGEKSQLIQAARAAKSTQNSAHQAQHQVQVVTAALNAAQATSEHANQAAAEAQAELASQTSMVGQAKARLQNLEEQLLAAKVDFAALQKAATLAQAHAQKAQTNAAVASVDAAEAAAALSPPGHAGHALKETGHIVEVEADSLQAHYPTGSHENLEDVSYDYNGYHY